MYINLRIGHAWKLDGEFAPAVLFASLGALLTSNDILVVGTYEAKDEVYEQLLKHSNRMPKGRACTYVVWEPFGDNSRYWIFPKADRGAARDVRELEEVFESYKASFWKRLGVVCRNVGLSSAKGNPAP